MSAAPATPPAADQIADKLRGVCVGTRDDLDVARHLFRGVPSYVIRDPLTFQTHRLDAKGYAIFVSLTRDRTLETVFGDLVERGVLEASEEEDFYRTVLNLHRLNYLNLPIADDERLYRRYQDRQKQRRMERLMSLFFLRVPLWNPDAFLDRTVRWVGFLFSRPFLLLWCVAMGGALGLAVQGLDELVRPFQGVLTAANLPLMFLLLIGLKVVHELGHAYACKRYGGQVPEMGLFLVVFAPLAYVDASASWGFSRKRHRLVVGLGGMYVESLVACAALYTFFLSEPGAVRDLAYNLVFLSGVATVLFNLNPLMRYDGYYILSDLLEIPNLRQRATEQSLGVLRRVLLGLPLPPCSGGVALRVFLVLFGVAVSLYRVTIVLVICGAIATKLLLLGLGLAAIYLAMTLTGLVRRSVAYLFFAPATAPLRVRAATVGVVCLAVLPLGLVLLPLPSAVEGRGVLVAREERVIHAGVDGVLVAVDRHGDRPVEARAVLARLESSRVVEALAVARARLEAARLRHGAYQVLDRNRAGQERVQIEACALEVERRREEAGRRRVVAGAPGRVVEGIDQRHLGRWVRRGEPLFTLASGPWLVKTVYTEADLVAAGLRVGAPVTVKTADRSDRTLDGTVERIVPAGDRTVEATCLSQVGGGEIVVDPVTGRAACPYFVVYIRLVDQRLPGYRLGMTCRVRCAGRAATVGQLLRRRVELFIARLLQQG